MAKAKTRSFVAAAVVLLTLGTSAARAGDCGGQKGKVIYDTAFKDEKGGFEETDVAKYGDPALKLTLRTGDQDIVFINTTTDATLGDYCATATMPMPIGEGNLASVGLTLLYKDDQNMLALLVFSDNTVQIERWTNGESDFVYNEETPAIKAAPGSTVSIRAIVERRHHADRQRRHAAEDAGESARGRQQVRSLHRARQAGRQGSDPGVQEPPHHLGRPLSLRVNVT